MPRAPSKEFLTVHGPVGNLEGLLEVPEGFTGNRVAVLCHPHPQYQGTMLNKVVHTLARAMTDLGIAALRFNFRGAGASEGTYAGGSGEVDDVEAVAACVAKRWPDADLWLAGFSFGAIVAARAALKLAPKQLISIAPAVNMSGRDLVARPAVPWLIVQGDADELVSVAAVRAWVASLSPSPELVVLPGVDHFFHGELVALRQTLLRRLQSAVR
jgi:alpha/beta superfamily hydrolase